MIKLRCLINCMVGDKKCISGEIYEFEDIIACQQMESSDFFKSRNKPYRVFFEMIVDNITINESNDTTMIQNNDIYMN